MSWLYSRALVEDCSQRTPSGSDQYAQLKTTITADAYLHSGKMIERCLYSQFGMTLKHLTQSDGEALLTSFLEGFLAKPTVPHRAEGGSRTTFGQKCSESWQMCLPGTYLPRTSWRKRSNARRKTLKTLDIKQAGLPLGRTTWVVTTFGSGIGYLHTPTTKANYAAASMQKWPSARAFVAVFGRPSPTNQEWMMAWPGGWTDTKPLEMDRFQLWRLRLFGHLHDLVNKQGTSNVHPDA